MGRAVVFEPPAYTPGYEAMPLTMVTGPIQGADDWQAEAIEQISDAIPGETYFANPRRSHMDDENFDYRAQTRWERTHLHRAAETGVVLTWLAARNPDLEYREGRAYGQTTRFEAAMMYERAYLGLDVNWVLGMDPGYEGSEKYYLDLADEIGIPVHHSLGLACAGVVELLTSLEN